MPQTSTFAARPEQTKHDEHSPNAALRVEFTTSQIQSADGVESSRDACITATKEVTMDSNVVTKKDTKIRV